MTVGQRLARAGSIAIIVAVFGSLFGLCVHDNGWVGALIIFGGVLGLIALTALSIWLWEVSR